MGTAWCGMVRNGVDVQYLHSSFFFIIALAPIHIWLGLTRNQRTMDDNGMEESHKYLTLFNQTAS
jgi:hypothetical protein